MASLQTIARACVDSFGLLHASNIIALRRYIAQTPVQDLIKELNNINSFEELRAVWEAGVPKQLQEAYFKRMGGQTL